MSANNTVSVIELASEASDNQSNRSNSPNNVNENESLSSVISRTDLQQILKEAEELKIFEHCSGVLSEKSEFKQKMKNILCCRICLELRRCPMYQCKYGHLLCTGCLNDILTESQIQNEIASCPECQTTITKELCFRNVAVEKTIAELPLTCPYCNNEFNLEEFECHVCEERPTNCTNIIIGCKWQGEEKNRILHEPHCAQLSATGYDILESLESFDEEREAGHDMYDRIMELLSVEKMTYNDLQLKQIKIENKKVFFETSKFSAFENHWLIRAYCNSNTSKSINYQLVAKSKLMSPMNLEYLILNGPYNNMEIGSRIHQFKFSEKAEESPYMQLDIPIGKDMDILYSSKRINIRIFMFIIR